MSSSIIQKIIGFVFILETSLLCLENTLLFYLLMSQHTCSQLFHVLIVLSYVIFDPLLPLPFILYVSNLSFMLVHSSFYIIYVQNMQVVLSICLQLVLPSPSFEWLHFLFYIILIITHSSQPSHFGFPTIQHSIP